MGQRHGELYGAYLSRMRNEKIARHSEGSLLTSNNGQSNKTCEELYYSGPDVEFSPLSEFYGEIGKYFVLTGPVHVLVALAINPIIGAVDFVATLGYTVGGPLVYFTKK